MTEQTNIVNGIDSAILQSFIERIERLEEDKKGISEDINAVFQEAKSAGFDKKPLKAILALRKMEQSEREENEFLVETYKKALGL